jgi:hypothetical protein
LGCLRRRGNFGVVTSIEYRLYPVSPLLAGAVFHPYAKAHEALRFYRTFSSATHEALTTYAVLMTSPNGNRMVAIAVCYDGPLAEGERLIAPIRRCGPPPLDQSCPTAYTELQRMFDAAFPPGRQHYVKAHFLREIRDEAIDILVDHFTWVPSPLSMLFFQQTGGAMRRGHIAYAHRDALYNMLLLAAWLDPGESEHHARWTQKLWQALQPYSTGGVDVNDIGQEGDEGADQIRAAYDINNQQLAELKQKYDP